MRQRGRLERGLVVAVLVVLAWLVGYPLVLVLLESLRGGGAGFREFFSRGDEWTAIWRSTWIALVSVVLSALIGVPLALLFERVRFPGRTVLGVLVALPVALPPLVGVIAFLFLYGESGLVARGLQAVGLGALHWRLVGPGAILLVHAYSMYVYFYLFVRAAMTSFDASQLEAARSLGAGRRRVLQQVFLPQLRPALIGASLLVFMTSLGSFSAPYIFGGGYRVMTTQIVASKLNGDLRMAYVETVMLALVATISLVLFRRLERGGVAATGRGLSVARLEPARGLAALAVTCVLAAILLLPHAVLVLLSFVPPHTWTTQALPPVLALDNYRELFSSSERWRPVGNSLWMALASTFVAVSLGVAAARLALRQRGATGRVIEAFVAMPWAIPGTVFAMALAVTFSVDRAWAGRFVWIGTPWILPLAYVVRSLPITGRSAFAGLRQLSPALEDAGRSLGASAAVVFRRIVLPLLMPSIVAGAGLALITALGDFVSSIVLYTFDTRPISIEILSSLRLQETGVAATYGVLLMILSAAIFLLWGRKNEGRKTREETRARALEKAKPGAKTAAA